MAAIEVTIAIVAVLWTALSTTMVACKQLNERRDTIIAGIKDGQKLSLRHRRLMHTNDWRSLHHGVKGYSLAFTTMLFASPFLADNHPIEIFIVGWVAALVPFFTLVSFTKYYFSENRLIEETLSDASVVVQELEVEPAACDAVANGDRRVVLRSPHQKVEESVDRKLTDQS